MGTITAEKAQSAVLDILRICGGPCFHCSYFLESLVEISLLSHFKSLCRGRNAPFSPHLEFNTLSCTLPRLGIPRGRLVRDNNFSVLYTSITSLRRVLVWSLLFLRSASVRSGWFDLPQLCPQPGVAFVLPSYLFYQHSCTGTSLACRKGCRDRLKKC